VTTPDPTISPDGNYRWDGTSWVPNTPPTAPAATPDTPAAPAPDAPAAPAPAPAAPAPVDTTPGAKVGDLVTVRLDDDTPAFTGLVVATVDGNTETADDGTERVLRDAGVLVARLPESTFVPNSALRD